VSKISELINQALREDSTVYASVSFGNIFNQNAQLINAETGVDCKGSEIIITSYDVAHIFKRHGNNKIELERGQIGVDEKDFELIKDIIFNYDNIERGKDLRNAKSIVFSKRIIVDYKLIVSVEGKLPNKKMVVKTLFKKP
jgi:hypothetical protein